MKIIPGFLSICLLGTGAVSANTVLIHNDFDGMADDIGPAFQELGNGNGGGSGDPATGIVSSGRCDSRDGAWGLNNVSMVDVSGADGFTVEWVVDSFSGSLDDINHNGFFFGVVAGKCAADRTTDALFNNHPAAIGIHLFENHDVYHSQMNILQDPEGGGTRAIAETPLGVGAPTPASLQDGFVLRLTLNSDNTWEASSTGLTPDFNTRGSLKETAGSPLYADLAGGLGIYSSIQGQNLNYTLDEVTLEVTSEPETLGLIM
jgi:hypothetical protein